MDKTPDEIIACRSAQCAWTEDAIRDALTLRFPGDETINIKALCESWLADKKLAQDTLAQCALLAWKVTKKRGKHSPFLNPRAYLADVASQL